MGLLCNLIVARREELELRLNTSGRIVEASGRPSPASKTGALESREQERHSTEVGVKMSLTPWLTPREAEATRQHEPTYPQGLDAWLAGNKVGVKRWDFRHVHKPSCYLLRELRCHVHGQEIQG